MNRRTIISETERERILNMHESFKRGGLLNEDEEVLSSDVAGCTDKLINVMQKKAKEYTGVPKQNSFKIYKIDGLATVDKNGKKIKLTTNMSLKKEDLVTLTNGSKVYFEHIDGWGGSHIECDNNGLEYWVYWE
jgi:hypothetical protein